MLGKYVVPLLGVVIALAAFASWRIPKCKTKTRNTVKTVAPVAESV